MAQQSICGSGKEEYMSPLLDSFSSEPLFHQAASAAPAVSARV